MRNICQTVNELQSVTWRDELVLTTAQLAEFYETSVDNIKKNFGNNRSRFVEGKHYFKVEGNDLRTLKREVKSFHLAANVNFLYLWTKRGAARHAKMLNTDRAWDVFELLEDAYFNRVDEKPFGYNDTTPGAEFWWEVKQPRQPSDFRRGVELKKLASHTRNPELREQLILEAAILIAGENFFID